MDCREHTKEELKKERSEGEELEERVKNRRGMFVQERRKHEAKQRAKEERKTKELKALQKQKEEELKQERHHCKKVEEEELGKRPRYTTSAQKEEQQEKREKAGPCPLLWVGGKARCDLLTTDLKTPKHQNRKNFLINNWVGERETDSRGKPDPLTSTYLLFAAQEAPKSQGFYQFILNPILMIMQLLIVQVYR